MHLYFYTEFFIHHSKHFLIISLDFTGPTIQVPTTIGPSYGCGTGETGYRSYCYTLVTSVSTFDGMQSICELRSANLVSIADASEMNFVISLMQTGKKKTTLRTHCTICIIVGRTHLLSCTPPLSLTGRRDSESYSDLVRFSPPRRR